MAPRHAIMVLRIRGCALYASPTFVIIGRKNAWYSVIMPIDELY